jgi:hypothetical protein
MPHLYTPFGKAHLRLPVPAPSALRLLTLLIGLLLFSQFSARADADFYEDFIVLRSGPTTTRYYTYTVTNPPFFQNANLGVFAPTATDALVLDGAEANTYQQRGNSVLSARLFYRVYEEGTLPGPFVRETLTYRPSDTNGNPNNKKWGRTNAGIDLVRVAGRAGHFVLEVYFEATKRDSRSLISFYDNNDGANYRATFTVGQAVLPYAVPSNAEVDSNFHTYVNQVFGGLEPNRVPTGLLADYGFEFADPRLYNGSLLADSTLMD